MLSEQLVQLGSLIKRLRVARGLRAEVLAASVNLSRATLNKIESGHPGVAIDSVFKVIGALGVSDPLASLNAQLALAAIDSPGRQKAPRRQVLQPAGARVVVVSGARLDAIKHQAQTGYRARVMAGQEPPYRFPSGFAPVSAPYEKDPW